MRRISARFVFRWFALALLPINILFAQPTSPASRNGTGSVFGRIVNAASARAISEAAIEVALASDSVATKTRPIAVVARGTSRADGSYRIDGLAAGRYRATVRAVGFTPQTLPAFTVGTTSQTIDLGTTQLAVTSVELQRITTLAERQRAIELAPDRNIYTVRDMPTTRGGSAIDILRNVPSVDVDIDNTVSLRGDAGVIVQINGRRSPLKPAQLGNFLAQLPAAMVEKVEIIPNPSARENPEGSSGIINIVLKKQADAGSSGGITIAEGTTGRSDVGINAGYKKKNATVFGSYGYSRDSRPRSESLLRDNLYASPLTFLDQTSLRTQIPKSHTATGTVSSTLGKHDEISADVLYSTRREDETTALRYRDLDAAHQLTGLRDRSSSTINHEGSFESTVEYKHAFALEDHELTGEVQFSRASEGGPSNYLSRTLALDGTVLGAPVPEYLAPQERPNERSVKLDYTRPLAEHLRVNAGYRGSLQAFHTTLDSRTFDIATNQLVTDTSRTTEFTFDQRVHAAYGTMTGSMGAFSAQAGLRVEQAGTQFKRLQSSTEFTNSYNSVFPSGLVVYNMSDADQIKLSYSTRISRPDDTDALDPTPHYQDPLNLSRGNPSLQPAYIRALELGFQRSTNRSTLQVTPFYRHTIDAVRRIRTIDNAGITTSTFANIATTDNYGTDVTLALHGGRATGFIGSSAYRQQSNAPNLSTALSTRTFGWSARTNMALRVSKAFDMQTILSYRARTRVEQGTNGSQVRVSFAARQKLLNNRVSVTLRVLDPFSTERETSYVNDARFTQVSRRSRQARGLLLNATWNFGRPAKDKRLDETEPTG